MFAQMGHLITFLVKSIGAVPLAFTHYRKEVWRLLSDVAWGNGAIVVGGGTVGVMVILGIMGGATVGIEGYTALNLLGMSPVTGGLSAFATTREIVELMQLARERVHAHHGIWLEPEVQTLGAIELPWRAPAAG